MGLLWIGTMIGINIAGFSHALFVRGSVGWAVWFGSMALFMGCVGLMLLKEHRQKKECGPAHAILVAKN